MGLGIRNSVVGITGRLAREIWQSCAGLYARIEAVIRKERVLRLLGLEPVKGLQTCGC